MKTLLDYLNEYEKSFCNKTFTLLLNDDNKSCFTIRFELGNFCHLLGIQYCFPNNKKRECAKGKTGVDNIRNGSITFERLQRINNKDYERYVLKKVEAFESLINYFSLGSNKLTVYIFDINRVVEVKDRDLSLAKLIFSDEVCNSLHFVYMFGKKEKSSSNIMFPVSLRKETGFIDYLDLQTPYKIRLITTAVDNI